MRKVKQAVSAKYKVASRQIFSEQVQVQKLPIWRPIAFLIGFDQVINDVRANVLDTREIHSSHPVEVTTGYIQNRFNSNTAK
jgi:hypothetical protein